MYCCSMVLKLRVCLDRHFVMLHVQILPHMELITTVCGMSMSNIQYSIIGVWYEYAVEVWYGPDELLTLDPESSTYLSGADSS